MTKKKLPGKHLEIISNGQGAPSMALTILAGRREVPARVSITADTGWEDDRLWSDGRRQSARAYFDEVTLPFCRSVGIEAHFIRANTEDGVPMPTLWQHTLAMIEAKRFNHIKIPLFGSEGGRLRQACTSRWKIAAINQLARGPMGVKTARFHQAIVMDEVPRRLKGINCRMVGDFRTYDQVERTKKVEVDGHIIQVPVIRKWSTVCYPLADKRIWRRQAIQMCEEEGLPYLISSECDGCPHQDYERWSRTAPAVLHQIAVAEAKMDGQFFFTDKRIPLLEAIEAMKDDERGKFVIDFGCASGGYCGV